MKNILYSTIALFLVTLLSVYFNMNFLFVFLLIVVTLVLGARLLGDSTEEIANHYSSKIGGLMNAFFGNLAELIIGFFALKDGLIDVVKASLTGSIIGNILLVFGASVFIGGFKFKESKLNKHEAEVSSTMLMLAALLLLIPSLLFLFHEEAFSVPISYAIAIGLFILYIASLIFSFYTHKHYFDSELKEKSKMKKSQAFIMLLVSVVILGVLSELFASRLETFAHQVGWGDLFIGAILVGIVGNAAEHLSAIQFARKNKMNLVLNTTIGSSLQIAMFVAPILVFVSAIMGNIMTLSFLPLEIAAIASSVFLLNEISKDGEVNWLEGLQLLLLYAAFAIVFFFAK